DLVVTNEGDDSLSLFLGNGDGTFQPQVKIHTGNSSTPRVITAVDVNHDGNLDLIYSIRCADLSECFFKMEVRWGRGTGKFSAAMNYLMPSGFAPGAVAFGDFNGDGKRDLVTAVEGATGQQISVFAGLGDGTFDIRKDYAGGGYTLAIGDFNGDSATD